MVTAFDFYCFIFFGVSGEGIDYLDEYLVFLQKERGKGEEWKK